MTTFWPRTAIAAGVLATMLASSASAAPPPRRYALVWTRTEGAEACPDSASIERSLEKRLGPISFVPKEQAELIIEAVVRKQTTLQAALTLRDAQAHLQGERALESDDATCNELVQSVALVAAVMIDPDAAANAPPDPPLAVEPRPDTPSAVPPAPPPPPPAESAPPPRVVRPTVLTPVAAVATGILPTLATGVGFDVWYLAQRYATFGVGVRYWGPQTVDIAGKSVGADFHLFDSIVSFCPVRREWSALEILGCAQLDFGLLSAAGNGGAVRSVARRPVVAPGAEVRLAYLLGDRWQVSANGAVEAPFRRDEFEYRGPGGAIALFQPSPVSARVEIGAGYAW